MLGRCVVWCLICCVCAEVRISKLTTIPEKFKDVEGCYIEELDTVTPFGRSQPSTAGCLEYLCEKNWVYHASCGVAVAMAPFELVEDKEKPYPECCPRLKDSELTPK